MQPDLGDIIVANYLPPNLSLEETGAAFDERVDELWTLYWAEQGPLPTLKHVCHPASLQQFPNRKNAGSSCIDHNDPEEARCPWVGHCGTHVEMFPDVRVFGKFR